MIDEIITMTVEDNSVDIPISAQDDSTVSMSLSTEQYIKGDKGDAATIQVGKVESTENPNGISITNSGTKYDAILDFVLPRGPKGDQGLPGVDGVDGKDFSIAKTYSSVAEMNADMGNVEENSFVLIASDVEDADNSKLFVKTGAEFKFLTDLSGAQGFKGEAATIRVGNVATLDPGSDVVVENVGTVNNAVFNISIPRGDTGAGIEIQGSYDSEEDLVAAHPTGEEGHAYIVGGNFYVWINGQWKNCGRAQGPQGEEGKAATIQIGTVTSGTAPKVTNSGTSNTAVLDFVLQKGDKGEAASIQLGTVTTGEPGTDVVINNSGDSTNAVLDFTIPKGTPGTAATVKVGTVAKGTEAKVTNSGTTTTAVFDFVLPQGDKGDPFTYEDFTQEQIDEIINGAVERADYATKDYVEQHGGKIDAILLNGTLLPITEKQVDIPATQVVLKRWAADETI